MLIHILDGILVLWYAPHLQCTLVLLLLRNIIGMSVRVSCTRMSVIIVVVVDAIVIIVTIIMILMVVIIMMMSIVIVIVVVILRMSPTTVTVPIL